MGSLNIFTKSLNPLRSYLVAEQAQKTSLQLFLENALGKTRQYLRVLWRKKNKLRSEALRPQHRLTLEYFPRSSEQTVSRSSKFSYRPGFINEVTSKWVTDSLAGTINKQRWRKVFQGARGPLLCFVGFGLAKKPSLLKDEDEYEAVSYEIREAFSAVPPVSCDKEASVLDVFNERFSLSSLKFGDLIAKGCNAAVYSASLAQTTYSDVTENEKKSPALMPESVLPCNSKVYISHSEGEQNYLNQSTDEKFPEQDFKDYHLAVKVMFNYSAESSAFAIWKAMHKEVLPVQAECSFGEFDCYKVRKKKLKPHPNIVKMYFAFADHLPLLPGAYTNYPQALPVRLLSDGCGRNMTLFLVMKRYHCSLKDYLRKYEVSGHTALLLFTQLLEALVHLLQNDVAHRDLKTDNILLDLSEGVTSPKLVVTDFGCCLENLHLKYQSPEIEKGGNMALMAPEVVSAEAGTFSTIDYSRSDLWTAGTLAYEIFAGTNPFYSTKSCLKNFNYDENSLPELPKKASPVVQRLVKDILHLNPKERPSQTFAATVCQILLLGPPDVSKCSSSKEFSQAVVEWMFYKSAETFIEASLHNTETTSVDFELRRTFCSRIQFVDVLNAVKYVFNV